MPTREDIEVATPLCHRRLMQRSGQHGVHFTCYQPMRYVAGRNAWRCDCGAEESGELIAARQRAVIAVAA